MTLEVTVIRDCDADRLPADGDFDRWAAVAADESDAVVAIRLVDEVESRRLNRVYRGKDRPTNVLSFPAELPEAVRAALASPPLGDLALCVPVVTGEAKAQGKPPAHHWAHLVVHGMLHLRGYDHVSEAEARAMESLEVRLLADLGIPDPYTTGN